MSSMDDLEKLADIPCDPMNSEFPKNQAITIGHSVVCDGYYSGKTTAVFSHFHEDHTYNIGRTLTECDNVILSQITYDALLGMEKIPERGTIRPLSDGETFTTDFDETIRLLDANHVFGSKQIMVTMNETGKRILYSGDFCYPGMTIHPADVLVLESEHGDATYDFNTDKQSVLRRISEQVRTDVEQCRPVVIKAHSGMMQKIIAHLEKAVDGMSIPEKVPFLAEGKDIGLTKATCKKVFGMEFRDMEPASNGRLNELHRDKQPYVLFARRGKIYPQEQRGTVINVDANKGFKNKGPFFSSDESTYFACLASHSSFSHVLDYVKDVGPELVIINGTRVNKETCKKLEHSISNDLQIRTILKTCGHD